MKLLVLQYLPLQSECLYRLAGPAGDREGKISTVLQQLVTLSVCVIFNLTGILGGGENVPTVRA